MNKTLNRLCLRRTKILQHKTKSSLWNLIIQFLKGAQTGARKYFKGEWKLLSYSNINGVK